MAHRPLLTPLDRLHERTEEYRRHLLIQSYSVMYSDTLDLLARGADPSQKSKSMSRRLGEIEAALAGKPAPEVVVLVPLAEMWERAARGMG